MSQNSYNQAVEITKIILQREPQYLLHSDSMEADIYNISEFVEMLAHALNGIEQDHLN